MSNFNESMQNLRVMLFIGAMGIVLTERRKTFFQQLINLQGRAGEKITIIIAKF